MSSDFNNSSSFGQMMKQTRLDYEGINNNLLKNIEQLDSENSKLKSALIDLQNDMEEKQTSIEESHRIIVNLNNAYKDLLKNYKELETYNKQIMEEKQNINYNEILEKDKNKEEENKK